MSRLLVIVIVVAMACMIESPVAAGTVKVELEITYDVQDTGEVAVTSMSVLRIKGPPVADPGGDTTPPLETRVLSKIPEGRIANPLFGKTLAEIGIAVQPGGPDPCGYVWDPITRRYYYRCW
jgi:hypothetical protein